MRRCWDRRGGKWSCRLWLSEVSRCRWGLRVPPAMSTGFGARATCRARAWGQRIAHVVASADAEPRPAAPPELRPHRGEHLSRVDGRGLVAGGIVVVDPERLILAVHLSTDEVEDAHEA